MSISKIEVTNPPNIYIVERSYNKLYSFVREMNDEMLRQGTLKVIKDPRFLACPAAKVKHQGYVGGLIVHTAEVVDECIRMAQAPHLDADYDVLVTAGVWHDYGKIYDYSVHEMPSGHVIDYAEHRTMIRHLSRSYAMFMAEFEGKISEERLQYIGHCILSHHGRREWGSPVEPLTTEAHILHYADGLSAFCSKVEYKVE